MKLENYPQKIHYRTNLEYPKNFWLIQRPPRRGVQKPQPNLEPLKEGDYIRLPVGYDNESNASGCYRVTSVLGDRVGLEIVRFRHTVAGE